MNGEDLIEIVREDEDWDSDDGGDDWEDDGEDAEGGDEPDASY